MLDKGRSKESSSDLTASPLTAWVYRSLGNDGAARALPEAKRMFAGEQTPQASLSGLDKTMVRALIEACAKLAISRRDALLALLPAA